jgi:hypothetical protein
MNRLHHGAPRRAMPALASVLAAMLTIGVHTEPAAAATAGSISMKYDGYAHGLIVLKVDATLTLTTGSYAGRLKLRTAGMINWLAHMDSDSQVRGAFQGSQAVPAHYDSAGTARGVYREMHIGYRGGNPVIEQQTPPVDDQHTPVPPADTAGSIDTMSAMALLVHRVGQDGTCDGALRLFDGRRLTALTARGGGEVTLPASAKTHFNGEALRCDFEGIRLAGFARADDMAAQQRPRHGSAWLASIVPGAPPVPVRVTFENKVLGNVTLYLTEVSGSPGPVAQNGAGPSRP